MNYKICKLHFKTGIHIGNGLLTGRESIFLADTLFSALCQEALQTPTGIEKIYQLCRNGQLKLSDALPFIENELYIPKPIFTINSEEEGNSIKKKAFKKLKYIPIDKLQKYMDGDLDAEKEVERFKKFGFYQMRANVMVKGKEDSEPYYVGVYQYNENNGVYICVAYQKEEDFEYFNLLLKALSLSGIGGKRSSGLGKFEIEVLECPSELKQRMDTTKYKRWMSLSLSMPKEMEMESVCVNANYQLIKRSGFVSSNSYASEFQKKRSFFGFAAGSCICNKYEGDIYDVSMHGNHPVYKYAIPLFMGVSKK